MFHNEITDVSERIAAARRSSPSPSLTADCEQYLDACADPAFFRITADAPAMIGWDAILDGIQELIAISLAAAHADGEISPDLPIATLARMLAAAIKEAGVMIATAPDPARARTDASASARYLIAGLQRTRP